MIAVLKSARVESAMKARIVLVFALVAASLLMPGCGGSSDEQAGRTRVVAAFYPLAFAAERIGGQDVEVQNLTPPGVEPHDLELSPRDVERIRAADVVLYLGGGFQPALEHAVDGARGRTVDLLEGLALHPGSGEEAHDPHVWLDPVRFGALADRIGEVLGRRRAAARVHAQLRALDRAYRRGLADCERRTVVTSHAAFGYLTDRYGLEQIAITGLSPEAEPRPRELERVARDVRRSGATTVFFETLVSPRLAETIARETGAETAVLDPLEGLTDDQLGRGEDYLSVMRANLRALREALGCR
jgi:zinc transport system substrate-binding protein